jgi:hypothetical protein
MPDTMTIKERSLFVTLLMCAPSFQGGHSEVGARLADVLGTKFPITMPNLAKMARKEGLDPDKLWPWWKAQRPTALKSLKSQ